MRLSSAGRVLVLLTVSVIVIQLLGQTTVFSSWFSTKKDDLIENTAGVEEKRLRTAGERLNGALFKAKVFHRPTLPPTTAELEDVKDTISNIDGAVVAAVKSTTALRKADNALINNDELFRIADTNRLNLTIFATVYKFRPRESFALLSWILTGAEVIVFVDDPTDIRLDPAVQRRIDTLRNRPRFINAPGPRLDFPLLNATFLLADELATTKWMCYVNADIVLPHYFGNLTRYGDRLPQDDVVFSGGRFDCIAPSALAMSFERVDLFYFWRQGRCKFHGWGGKDFFLFHKGFLSRQSIHLPPFRLGVDVWDDWFLNRIHRWGVDASGYVPIVHLDHGGRAPEKRLEAKRENGFLASCNQEQRRKYYDGEPFSSGKWAVYNCHRNMTVDKLPRQVCPVGNGDAVIAPIFRKHYRPRLWEAANAFNSIFYNQSVDDSTSTAFNRVLSDALCRANYEKLGIEYTYYGPQRRLLRVSGNDVETSFYSERLLARRRQFRLRRLKAAGHSRAVKNRM